MVIIILIALALLFVAYTKAGKKVANVPAIGGSASGGNVSQNTNIATALPKPAALTTASCPSVISEVATTQKIVALTYDVGTAPGDLAKTVPAVKAANVPATFFITGKLVEKDKVGVQQIHDAGFPIYNHTYDNLRFPTLTPTEVQAQLQAADDLIRSVTNVTTKPYARIPYGASTPEALTAMREAGYCGLTWTVDGLDIESTATVESVTNRITRFAKPGAIILLHAGSDLAATATPRIVAALQQAGYRFVSLDDLFRAATTVPGGAGSGSAGNTNTPAASVSTPNGNA
ncbi:MAG: polysaccharide deacetylase family protein [bacterium]|nr:polysaccharide deacetylase family protein [bacterium]